MSKRNKKPLPLLRGIDITDIAAEGKAIAKVDEMVVFVPFAVPGDVVDLRVSSTSCVTPKSVARLCANTSAYAVGASGRYCHTTNSYGTSSSR